MSHEHHSPDARDNDHGHGHDRDGSHHESRHSDR
jgi:hypothetical protein